ncbi:hypothetical protein V8G54_014044 [Vigna mungo]|uniref:DNA-directed RNA polymerase N-terminal domain-containing protein n=1 Tax=Vigna mungo TaxID=3915 RepID=A0AAQ3RZ19_VIGMU
MSALSTLLSMEFATLFPTPITHRGTLPTKSQSLHHFLFFPTSISSFFPSSLIPVTIKPSRSHFHILFDSFRHNFVQDIENCHKPVNGVHQTEPPDPPQRVFIQDSPWILNDLLMNGIGEEEEEEEKHNMLRRRQIQMETEALENMVEEYRELEREMREKNLISNLPHVKALFLGWFDPLKEAIEAEQKSKRSKKQKAAFAPHIDSLPAAKMAVIVMHKLMGLVSMEYHHAGCVLLVDAAIQIGMAVEQEVHHMTTSSLFVYQLKGGVISGQESEHVLALNIVSKSQKSSPPPEQDLCFCWFCGPRIISSPGGSLSRNSHIQFYCWGREGTSGSSVSLKFPSVVVSLLLVVAVRIHNFLEKTRTRQSKKTEVVREDCTDNDTQKLRKHVNGLIKRRRLKQVQMLLKGEEGPWGRDTQAKLGSRLIDLLIQTAFVHSPVNQSADTPPDIRPAFRHRFKVISKNPEQKVLKNYGVIECDPLILAGMDKSVKHMLMPYMPMLVPPKKWKGYGTWNTSY